MVSKLDPVIADLLGHRRLNGDQPAHVLGVVAARAQMDARFASVAKSFTASEQLLAVDGGRVPLWLYLHPEPNGVVIYLHGGGWTVGSPLMCDWICARIALDTGCDVVNVAYRLAPENPFPTSLNDTLAAVRWASERYPRMPIIIAGDSAGANLASVAAIKLRDTDVNLVLQVLAYPVTDGALNSDSYVEYKTGPSLLTRESMRWYLSNYVPDSLDWLHPDVSPLYAADLSGLPPAHVIVAEHDPVRDDGLRYEMRLSDAGVRTTLDYYAEMPHGFLGFRGVVTAPERSLTGVVSSIKSATTRYS